MFAGTGNISYEFASRGSSPITSVDGDFGCVKFIKQTANEYYFNIAATKSDVFKFLEKATSKSTIIFADPPYDYPVEKFAKIPELVFQNTLLEDDGVLIVEHSKRTDLSQLAHYTHSKSYGGNMFSFFE